MIKVSNLVHSYLKYGKTEEDTISVKALDHVDMEIDKGEFIAIIGHNGSGKSTLAKHFNGLLFPAEGTVWINELPTSDHKNLGQIRRTVCMVFQNPDNQIIGATVEEDISFGLENMQIPREQMQDRIDRSLEAVRMTDKRQANPGSLSGGQKQKTAIAGAVAVSPECLVLDEATAMLDPKARREVIGIARELNEKQGITIILITHFMDEVTHADKIFVMDHGIVAESGAPEELFREPELLEKYRMELPPVTRLAYSLRKKGLPVRLPVMEPEDLAEQMERIYRGEQIC